MPELKLWFARDSKCEHDADYDSVKLTCTEFSHPLLQNPISAKNVPIRASTAVQCGRFTWSAAVMALCLLATKTCLQRFSNRNNQAEACLKGNKGSAASSLDYAITKQNSWLASVFGTASDGSLLIARLIRRANPGQRRDGDICISFNANSLLAKNIHIFINQTKVSDQCCLTLLHNALERLFNKQHCVHVLSSNNKLSNVSAKLNVLADDTGALPSPFSNLLPYKDLRTSYTNEILSMLRMTDIFSTTHQNNLIHKLLANPSFIANSPAKIDTQKFFYRPKTAAEFVGMSGDCELALENFRNDRLRIAIAPSLVGAMAIFLHLRTTRRLNIELDYMHLSTLQMMEDLCSLDPRADAYVLTEASLAQLFSSKCRDQFIVLCPLPKVSHAIVRKKAKRTHKVYNSGPVKLNAKYYMLLLHKPGSAKFYLDDLQRMGLLNGETTNAVHAEAQMITKQLSQGDEDLNGMFCFPYYYLNERLNNCEILGHAHAEISCRATFLVIRKKKFGQLARLALISTMIRDAWLELRHNEAPVSACVELMLKNKHYLRFLSRCCGLHHLSAKITQPANI